MKLLELHFAQLSRIWSKSQSNVYSDRPRKEYHDNLKLLFSFLEKEDFASVVDESESEEKRTVLRFFCDSIAFLDHSTVTALPFELVRCLEIALNDWSPGEDYIIVTSLSKGLNEYSFDPSLATNDLQYDLIETNYGIQFPRRLIQVRLPEYLVGDYLSNVVMYHELGHFLEVQYSIPEVLFWEFYQDYLDGKLEADFHIFVPFLRKDFACDFDNLEARDILKLHIGEYFCDLFASQYIGNSLNCYLTYISDEGTTKTHPATSNRVSIVDKFLQGNRESFTLNKIEYVVKSLLGQELKIRHKEFKSDDFLKLLPIQINEESELHYLFIHGWKLWLSDWNAFKDKNKMSYDLTATQVHQIINDLIEKSIGNFIIRKTWDTVKDVFDKRTDIEETGR